MITLLAIIQARLSSARLPGKVLKPILGSCVLDMQIERLATCPIIDDIVVATSTEPSDDPLQHHCESHGIRCVRGNLNNVYGRFCQTLADIPSVHFLRYCADRPWFDLSVLVNAWKLHLEGNWDITTTASTPTFPKGLTVEIARTEAFLRAQGRVTSSEDQEHVMPFFYRHPEEFRICSIVNSVDMSATNLCLDTPADYEYLMRALEMTGDGWKSIRWEDTVNLYQRLK